MAQPLTSVGSIRPVCLVALLVAAALSIVLTFVLPRPLCVWENDYDNGHYYNARAAFYGLPIHNVEHPGTPVILLERLLMTSWSAQPEHVQSFLNELYLVVGLAYCGSVALFCVLVLRRFSAGVAALTLSSLAAWPAFLMGLNYYCTESFVLVVGLLALAVLWEILESFPRPRLGQVLLGGAVCGLCLAVKLSFVPFVLSLEAAVAISILRSKDRFGEKALKVFLLGISTCLAFATAIWPVLQRLDEIVINTVWRNDVRMQSGLGQAIAKSGWALLRESPFFPVLFMAAFVLAIMVGVRLTKAHASTKPSASAAEEGFDRVAGLVFVVLLACGFIYSLACGVPDLSYSYSVGNAFRNASASALVVPFAILYVARANATSLFLWESGQVWRKRLIVTGAAVIAMVSIAIHFSVRQRMIHERGAEASATVAGLAKLQHQYGLVALWDKSVVGAISFNFWGNYRYASSHFDSELLNTFRGYSWLDLRDIQGWADVGRKSSGNDLIPGKAQTTGAAAIRRSPVKELLHWIRGYWLAWKSQRPAFPERPAELYAGEKRGLKIGLLAFPEMSAENEVYRRLGWSEADLKFRLESELGPLRLWKERIGGVEWILMAPRKGAR